ncbi:LOW QUALITY PROTEIN: hypothetical protein PHPALM_28048 [Phytophthora palmivora]|uniref:Uncharacterized protein n=1 Tax=Phytophthora palmivora TaxID=4796 RepID=A0A2P4XB44_9STRA|nr:LOW QUALITY PROTEIN: hypothetical protein PHPALM_28048 [Phytophthora palmivora]
MGNRLQRAAFTPRSLYPVHKRSYVLGFEDILAYGHLAALPVRILGELPSPNVEFYIDSSNQGLAVLDPGVEKIIQIQFDCDELLIHLTRKSILYQRTRATVFSLSTIDMGTNLYQLVIYSDHQIGGCSFASLGGTFQNTLEQLFCVLSSIVCDPSFTETIHERFSKAKSLATTSTVKYAGTWSPWTRWCQLIHFAEWLLAETE